MKYQDLGVVPIISAQANSTPLGGCTLSEGVIAAMGNAARQHVEQLSLWRAAGEFLSGVTGSEDAIPVTGAAAGMVIAVAACVAGTDSLRVSRLPEASGSPNEVVLQKGHSISYGGAAIGQMIAMGGGRAVEVGAVNAVEPRLLVSTLNQNTAALVYVTSYTHTAQKKGISLEEMVAIGREHGLPVIVDAAGEPDLQYWVRTGADLVIYSGPKMLGSPTAGFICGRADLIAACRAQYEGVARPMKVGKENLMGLLQAVHEYVAVPDAKRAAAQQSRMAKLANRLNKLPGVSAEAVQDDSGRSIYRVRLEIDPAVTGWRPVELDYALRLGNPAIYLRDFKLDRGQLEIDPRALSESDEEVLARCLEEMLSGGEVPTNTETVT